jgi:NADPH:quinone reductase-like Zn-dependent oxidoreductase
MKVIQFTEYGVYDKLQIVDRDKPTLQSGQLLVKVTVAAVNPVDNTLRLGGIKARVQFPKILGNEGAGVVVEGNDEFPAGTEFTAKITDFVWKGIQMRGASLSLWSDPKEHVKAAGVLLPLLAEGKINPTVGKIFPLEQIGEANRYLIEDRPFGKVLVKF